jgi:hypothetical protein
MLASRVLFGAGILAFSMLLQAQTPPTAYTIAEAIASDQPGVTQTIYRSGTKVLFDTFYPARRVMR